MTTLTSSLSFALTLVFLVSGCTVDLNDLRGIPKTDASRTETPPDAGMTSLPPDANFIPEPSDVSPTSSPDVKIRPPDADVPVMVSDAGTPIMTSDAGIPVKISDAGTPIMFPDADTTIDTQSTDRGPTPDSFPDYKPSYNLDALSFQPDVTPQPIDLQPSLKPLGSPCSIICDRFESDKAKCECASGFCDLSSSSTGKCSTKLPLGAACGIYNEPDPDVICQSGRCFFNKCELNCYPFCQDAG